MARLIQLKNGDWIDPATITGLHALDESDEPPGGYLAPRLIVHHHGSAALKIDYPTLEAACRARDDLAALVTAAAPSSPSVSTAAGGCD